MRPNQHDPKYFSFIKNFKTTQGFNSDVELFTKLINPAIPHKRNLLIQ